MWLSLHRSGVNGFESVPELKTRRVDLRKPITAEPPTTTISSVIKTDFGTPCNGQSFNESIRLAIKYNNGRMNPARTIATNAFCRCKNERSDACAMFMTLSMPIDANMTIDMGLGATDVDIVKLATSVTITPRYPIRICCSGVIWSPVLISRFCRNAIT